MVWTSLSMANVLTTLARNHIKCQKIGRSSGRPFLCLDRAVKISCAVLKGPYDPVHCFVKDNADNTL